MLSKEVVLYRPQEIFPRPFKGIVRWYEARRARNAILDSNKLARARLSSIAERMRDLFEDPEYRIGEHQAQFGTTISNFEHPEEKAQYSAWVSRDPNTGKPLSVWVVTRPLDTTHYSTGANDGDWFLHYHPDYSSSSKTPRLVVTEGKLQDDWYMERRHLAPEERDITPRPIKSVNVTHDATEVELEEISFGGWPSLHVWFRAWGEDPKTNQVVGPIGRIRQMRVLAVGRQVNPTVGSGVMESELFTIPLPDDFTGDYLPINMPRGGIDLALIRRQGTLALKAVSTWQRPPDRQLYIGNRPVRYEGPTERTIVLPSEYLNGFKIIEMLEKAADDLFEAYLQSKNE